MTVEIRKGHALDLIETFGDYDLLCTDPPYAMGGEGAEHAVSATVATVLRESGRRLVRGGARCERHRRDQQAELGA